MGGSMVYAALLVLLLVASHEAEEAGAAPSAAPWPPQFHALLFVNTSAGALQTIDLWYDWPKGRNFNIIHHQLGFTLHDLEWTNGTSFFYDLDAGTCSSAHVDVGILRPDWMVDNATYLGQYAVDGFSCNAWSKADFIIYYEDMETNRPVHWVFYTGMSIHVMTYEVGAILDDDHWQAPISCFNGNNILDASLGEITDNTESGGLIRWLHGLEASPMAASVYLKRE